MTKRVMPKDEFEVDASTVARLHLLTGQPLNSIARRIWKKCRRELADEDVVRDLMRAAAQALAWLEEERAPDPTDFFRHLEYFCARFDDEGRLKKRSLFGGLWFRRTGPNPRRVEDYVRKVQVYYAGAAAGLMPTAPDGWSPASPRVESAPFRSSV